MDIFKVGDKVKCDINGEGIVFCTTYNEKYGNSKYPVSVGFPTGKVESYTADGRELISACITHPIVLEVIEEPIAKELRTIATDYGEEDLWEEELEGFFEIFDKLPVEDTEECVD